MASFRRGQLSQLERAFAVTWPGFSFSDLLGPSKPSPQGAPGSDTSAPGNTQQRTVDIIRVCLDSSCPSRIPPGVRRSWVWFPATGEWASPERPPESSGDPQNKCERGSDTVQCWTRLPCASRLSPVLSAARSVPRLRRACDGQTSGRNVSQTGSRGSNPDSACKVLST